MGLDMYLTARKYHTTFEKGDDGRLVEHKRKLVDGMPLQSQEMELMYWRKNHWLHGWIVNCFANGEDNCEPIELDAVDLEQIARKLEKWADDPAELAPTDGFFFGVRETDDNYIEWRDEYRADAKAEAADLRRAVEWLQEDTKSREWRSVQYQASW